MIIHFTLNAFVEIGSNEHAVAETIDPDSNDLTCILFKIREIVAHRSSFTSTDCNVYFWMYDDFISDLLSGQLVNLKVSY